MSRPAVFFDRDNTLIANDGYLGDPASVVLVPGAAAAVARARALGFAVVAFSNQSGVARGLFTEEAVHLVNSRLDEMLLDQHANARIDRHEYCPYHPEAVVERYKKDSELRKPRPGMIVQAAERLNLDLDGSWVIGDAPRDIDAGKSVGCRAILFNEPSLKPSAAAEEAPISEPDFVVTSLEEALDVIEQNMSSDAHSQPAGSKNVAEEPKPAADANEAAEAPVGPTSQTPPPAAGALPSKMTFAERVRTGTFQPARGDADLSEAAVARPRKANPSIAEHAVKPAESAPQVEPAVPPAEPVNELELIEPLLQQILEEVRLMRQQHPGTEFAVTKLLAGIVQILVLPALFFAYLHRDVAADFQSLLMLATFLQTLTIALLIMGRQQ